MSNKHDMIDDRFVGKVSDCLLMNALFSAYRYAEKRFNGFRKPAGC